MILYLHLICFFQYKLVYWGSMKGSDKVKNIFQNKTKFDKSFIKNNVIYMKLTFI